MSNDNKKEARRYIGKVKKQQGAHGEFLKILIESPNPTNKDGTPNQYYKGNLLWLDAQTGKKYLVKQVSVRGVSEKSSQNGFTNSLSIDLDNEYEVQELG